jgi:tetratricopeptide (TPR) repeat protein
MRSLFLAMLLSIGLAAQTSPPAASKPQKPDSSSSNKSSQHNPNLAPPRSDRVDASSLPDDGGESSSKNTQIDLSPPPNDAKEHPQSGDVLMDEGSSGGADTMEFHPWDPHKAAKDIEVGDFYFKRKNYRAAEDRYREALLYKDNDAEAIYKLAICLEKLNRPDEALTQYQGYLKTLPYGPEAPEVKRSIERLKPPAANAKPN